MAAVRKEERAVPIANKQPFVGTARIYFDRGWLPFPLPPKAKKSPPTGFTGFKNDHRKINQKQVDSWLASGAKTRNVGLWLPPGVLGIDVDAYKANGRETLEAMEREMGPLPASWISSARDDGASGIRFYRVPEGLSWPGILGPGIETIHVGHRYAVVSPSIHPELHTSVLWYAPGSPVDGDGSYDIPLSDDLEELPAEWVEYITRWKFNAQLKEADLGGKRSAIAAVRKWIEAHAGEPCAAMLRAYEEVTDSFEGASAHDNARDGFFRMASLAAEGHPGFVGIEAALEAAFLAEVSRDDRDGAARGPAEAAEEYGRLRDAGIKKVILREQQSAFIGSSCTCTGLAPDGAPKPSFLANNYYLPDVLAKTYAALRADERTGWDGVYARGEQVWYVRRDISRPLSLDALRGVVARGTDWFKPGKEDGPPAYANPPRDVLASLLEDESLTSELPGLRGVVSAPFWADVEGKATLVHENGYHAPSKILLRMGRGLSERVTNIRGEWVEKAVAHIEDVLVDFPFGGPPDKAAVYAAMLQPFIRDLIAGPTPLFLVDAPQAGTGKSYLTEIISIPACDELNGKYGFQRIAVTDDRNRNVELIKEINARMQQDPRVVLMDNVNGHFTGGALSSALTSNTYQVRIIGTGGTAEVENRALWMMTANNPDISEELVRRIVPCRLNAKTESPELRADWTHPNLIEYATGKRDALVWSLLVLVQNWVESGQPDGPLSYNSYPEWGRIMSGILSVAGIPGLLENARDFRARVSSSTEGVQPFVDEWWSVHKTARVTSTDLALLTNSSDLVPEDVKARPQRMGRQLSDLVDRVFGEFAVQKTTLDGKSVYYLQPKGKDPVVKRRRRRAKGG